MRINFKRSVWLTGAALAVGLLGCAPESTEAPATTPGNSKVTPPAPTEASPTAQDAVAKDKIATIRAKVRKLSSYKLTLVFTEQGQTETSKLSIKQANAKLAKMTMATAGDEVWTLIDVAGQAVYEIDPSNKTAVKTTDSDADLARENDWFETQIAEVDQPDAKFSEDTLDGKQAWKIETTQQGFAMWFDPATGLPIKAEAPGRGSTFAFTYSELNAVPDATFAVPAGYTVTNVDS